MQVENYTDDLSLGDSTALCNNSEIWDDVEQKYLTEKEIAELELFINPLDGTVFKVIDGVLCRDTRYNYDSY